MAKMAAFDDAVEQALNPAIQGGVMAAAAQAGANATFVDVTGAFAGHGICDADSSWLFADNLHPTVAGQNAYARVLRAAGAR